MPGFIKTNQGQVRALAFSGSAGSTSGTAGAPGLLFFFYFANVSDGRDI